MAIELPERAEQYIGEGWLKAEIEGVWGPAGAHADIYGSLLVQRERLLAVVQRVADNEHLGAELRQAAKEVLAPWRT